MKCLQVLVLGVTLIAVANAASLCMKGTSGGTPPTSFPCTKTDDKCAGLFNFSTGNTPVLVELGCKTDLDSKCSAEDKYCVECEGENCNKDWNTVPKFKCLECKSDPDKTCIKTPSTVTKLVDGYLCSTTLLPADNTGVVHITRTAINDNTAFNKCKTASDSCKLCDKDNCTDEPKPRNKCNADICMTPSDTCVASYEKTGQLISSGCKLEFDCTNKYCKACTGNGCTQSLTPRKCIQCANSDTSCTTKYSSTPATSCELDQKCFVDTVDGKNNRGCTSDDKCPNGATVGENCHVCDTDGCNNVLFPASRRQCKETNDKTQVCLNPSDNCVGIYNSNGVKDKELCAAENEAACNAAGRLCLKCGGTECVTDISKSCYSCAGPTCDAISAKTEVVHTCNGCITKIAGNGNTTRGCAAEKEECASSLNCKKCTGMFCNDIEVKSKAKKCYQCNEETDGCGKQLNDTAVATTDCLAKTIGGFELCYVFRKEIKRGCLSSLLATEDYGKCTAESQCDICPDDGCNKQDINASAVATGAMLLVAIGALVASITN